MITTKFLTSIYDRIQAPVDMVTRFHRAGLPIWKVQNEIAKMLLFREFPLHSGVIFSGNFSELYSKGFKKGNRDRLLIKKMRGCIYYIIS